MAGASPAAFGYALEVTLYVIFLFTFGCSLAYTFGYRRSRPVNIPITILTYTLFPICTAHLVLTNVSLFTFINEDSPLGFFLVSFFIPLIIITAGDVIGVILLLYRCWLLWDRRWAVIAVPIIGVVLSIVFAGLAAASALEAFGIPAYAMPLVTHIVITTLIIVRLYRLSAYQMEIPGKSLRSYYVWKMIFVVVESGILYVIGQSVVLGLLVAGSALFDAFWIPLVQVYGIASMLIFLRTSWAAELERRRTTAQSLSAIIAASSQLMAASRESKPLPPLPWETFGPGTEVVFSNSRTPGGADSDSVISRVSIEKQTV